MASDSSEGQLWCNKLPVTVLCTKYVLSSGSIGKYDEYFITESLQCVLHGSELSCILASGMLHKSFCPRGIWCNVTEWLVADSLRLYIVFRYQEQMTQ
jgi:hypothetical protein